MHAQGKTILSLGLFGASASTGAFFGAIYAGSHNEIGNPVRLYAWFSLTAAAALTLFLFIPIGLVSPFPLAILGFIAFSQAVWNTSRVRLVANPSFQARLQSLTTMAFTLGAAFGQLWGGIVVDRFGVRSLAIGAAGLILLAIAGFRMAHSGGRQATASSV